MIDNVNQPVTYLQHMHQIPLLKYLQHVFSCEKPELKVSKIVTFLQSHPLPLEDFPRLQDTYTRTVLYRAENGFEAMAARWSKGSISSIHGHPYFNFYFVMHGCLEIDDYQRSDRGLMHISSATVPTNGESSFAGSKGTFDNNIHQVHAFEETLSIHISSDDSAKGEVFSV